MDITIEKDVSGLNVASCNGAHGLYSLRADYVFIRASDSAVMIGNGKGLREAKLDDEIALTKAIILQDQGRVREA